MVRAVVRSFFFCFVLCVAGCQGSGAGRAAAGGQVVFVDVAGNQMMVDVAASSPDDELSWAGEVYEDTESFEARVQERGADRFFVVPDGSGSTQTLMADDVVGVADPSYRDDVVGVTDPSYSDAHWVHCAVPVALALLPVAAQQRHTLAFPVIEKGLRYAGYRVPLPAMPLTARAQGLSVWSYVRKGRHVDVLIAALNEDDGNITAVIDNMATETIPESAFRYGSVGGSVRLAGAADPVPTQWAVLDGEWVRASAPGACWPPIAVGPASAGQVVGPASAGQAGEGQVGQVGLKPDLQKAGALSSGGTPDGMVTLEFSGGRGE